MRERPSGCRGRWGQGAGLLVLLASLLLPGVALARNHALLVGVADYDEPKIRDLAGPRNDVVALWRYLTRNGFAPADIEVLAEGLPQAPEIPPAPPAAEVSPTADMPRPRAAPDRGRILAGLAGLAARAQAGDLVLFHFSGHGTTQPEASTAPGIAPEAGGRDQVLLPRDAGLYDPATRTIRNGIVDDELGAALDRIRATGATVWVVIDACHAGTVTRSGDATRGIDAATLGVPPGSPERAPSPAPARPPERSGTLRGGAAPQNGMGPLIGFFAVDAWTEAIERPYPASREGAEGAQATFGVFTWHLLRALEAGRAQTFRDLARMVSLDIAASARLAQAPLPVFEGDLDRTLSGTADGGIRRFAARRDGGDVVIEAGLLQGFDEGAQVAVFDGPLADARRLGTARLSAANVAESRAEPAGPVLPGEGLWAQLERPGVAFRFRVAGVEAPAAAAAVSRALAPGESVPAIGVDLVAPGAPADLTLHIAEDRLWLVPQGGRLVRDPQAYGRSASIPLELPAEAFAQQLRNAVWAYARAANLVRIASSAEMAGTGDAGDIDIVLERIRETDPARLVDPRRPCGQISQAGPAAAVDSGTAAAVAHCDMVRLTIANRSERDLDLGIFLLDPLAGIDVPASAWRQNGCIATLPAKASGPLVLRTTLRTWSRDAAGRGGPSQIGLHRILVFALPRTGGIPPSLCALLQRDVAAATAGAAVLRSAPGRGGFLDLLARAALADPGLRAANPFAADESEAGSVVVRQFTLDLLAPEAER